MRQQLRNLLYQHSFLQKRVVLSSGKESDFFLDCKQTILTAQGHALAGELVWQLLQNFPPCKAVAGVALGGCPLASAVALLSYQKGQPLDALYLRAQAKDHGSKRLIEGDHVLFPQIPVVLLEDVVTTGASTKRAIDHLRAANVTVVGVLALVDRLEGGGQSLEQEGVLFKSLFNRDDFLKTP